ncbi:MAG: porin, partial [Flavipsychrobacter sp.]|nr:porin [Flavipsychrobacter sp.]
KIRKRFSHLVSSGLKGSGDYGVVGLGVFNGQTMNKPELNNELHIVGRVTYPFQVGKKQIIEPAVQAYTGHFIMPKDQISPGVKTKFDRSYLDQRVAAGFTLYPQPLGIQVEYNIGTGPEFNKVTDSIEEKGIKGGYAMINYNLKYKNQSFFPFVRMQYYSGGKKQELDARSYTVNEYEAGIEWQPIKYFELTVMYTISERRFEDYISQNNNQKGNLLRIQAQLNF